ncbi:MAG: carbon monoxide dehydrogenase subunit G [Rhodobacteraceae bacterium]|nr:carbon monoxide dehydrogenase subunit G [Paracoccaceae bacterium]
MKLDGKQLIRAKRHTVWEKLNDPDVLKQCIPGCREFTGSSEEGFEAVVTQKIGPVKATFRGMISLSDVEPGRSYTINGEGKGGAAGFARGSVKVLLTDLPEGTELAYDADARIGGKLAQLGSRLVGGVSKKLTAQFFDKFGEIVENR